jgi:ribose 5-phosphate isomerase B
MVVAVASDHAGFAYKCKVIELLKELGHEVLDFGTDSDASCDYPDYVFPAAESVADGKADRAIVFGGSGNGEAITANRVIGVRCALVHSLETAQLARTHNNANAISFGQRITDEQTMLEAVKIFLTEEFEGGRHEPRIAKIDKMAQERCKQS